MFIITKGKQLVEQRINGCLYSEVKIPHSLFLSSASSSSSTSMSPQTITIITLITIISTVPRSNWQLRIVAYDQSETPENSNIKQKLLPWVKSNTFYLTTLPQRNWLPGLSKQYCMSRDRISNGKNLSLAMAEKNHFQVVESEGDVIAMLKAP